MKSTIWNEIIDYEIKAVQISRTTGRPLSITIKSREGTRIFTESRTGNWYWRTTRRESDAYANGYIIRDGETFIRRAMKEGKHTIVGADGYIEILD